MYFALKTFLYLALLSVLSVNTSHALSSAKTRKAKKIHTQVLLLKMEGSNGSTSIVDNEGHTIDNTKTPLVTHSTSVKKYDSSSGYFNGGRLRLSDDEKWWLSTKNFTLEAWIYPTSVATAYQTFFSQGLASEADLNTVIQFRLETSKIRGFLKTTGNVIFGDCMSASGAIVANQWQHIAYVRSGSNFDIYVNGTSVCTASSPSSAANSDAILSIGQKGDNTSPFTGYIDELRWHVGRAIYNGAFTPPTEGF